MKQSLLLFLSVFLLMATANTAQAFYKKDLAKLKKTKTCVKCDLSGANLKGSNLSKVKLLNTVAKYANLTGASWPNHKKCKKGSIGKCN